MLITGRAGVADDIVRNEKVGAEVLLPDHGQLAFHPQPRPLKPGTGRVAADNAGEGQLFQQGVVSFFGAGKGAAVDV